MKATKPQARQSKPRTIDWQELRQRLESARAELESSGSQAIEDKKRILRERAKALARKVENESPNKKQYEVLEFLLAYERYAIETRYVREVSPLKDLTPVPCTPTFVLGVINVRGQILSVIDIKRFFDLPDKGLTDLNKVIVVKSDAMEIGLLADVIVGVREVADEDIQPSLPTLTGIRSEYLIGVAKERLVVLDARKLLSDGNIVVQEEVTT
jgi:purine-binding chemotaxis protein CheW